MARDRSQEHGDGGTAGARTPTSLDGTTLLGWHDQDDLPVEPQPRSSPVLRWASGLVTVLTAFAVVQLALSAVSLLVVRGIAPYRASSDPRMLVTELPQILELTKNGGHHAVYLDELPLALRALGAAPGFLSAVVLLLAGVLVVGLLSAVGQGRVAWNRALSLLGRLGAVLVGGGLLVGVVDTVAVRRVLDQVWEIPGVISIDGLRAAAPSWPWLMIVAGLVALALRLVFREGARIQEELDGVA